MPEIPFTQYLRPYGRQIQTAIDRPMPTYRLAERLLKAGYHFDVEHLFPDEASFTVEPNRGTRVPGRAPDDESPIAHAVCPNGPAVLAALDKLFRDAVAVAFPGPLCGCQIDDGTDYCCTLPIGHAGEHIATVGLDGPELARWL